MTSINSDLRDWGESLSSYYDIFINNAFGNYKDILLAVTKHPAMGYYLSHLNNPKTDLVNNIRPDENYAREIMQLFTIGLFELNQNGTRKMDASGDPIPTYTNEDIKELAKYSLGCMVVDCCLVLMIHIQPNVYVGAIIILLFVILCQIPVVGGQQFLNLVTIYMCWIKLCP